MSNARIALVTGGAGGLGYTICTKLDEKGYRVVLTHSPGNTTIKETLAELKAKGHDFTAYPVDVADYDSCQRCVAQVQKDIGPIDILINNAGITRDMTFRKMSKSDWDAVMRTNLDIMFNMTKQVMDGMLERGWGRIINVARSTAARAPSARPTTRPRRPASTASPSRWRSKWRGRESPSTPSARATSGRRW